MNVLLTFYKVKISRKTVFYFKKKRPKFYLIIIGILILGNICGSFAQDQPKTLLWEVRRVNNPHVSYIFGTFHEVGPSFFNSLTNVVAKLNQANLVYVEEVKSRSTGSDNPNYYKYWTKHQWQKFLTPDQNEIFMKYVSKAEDSSYFLLPPLTLLLGVSRLYMQNFCEEELFSYDLMDRYIEEKAKKQNIKVLSLDQGQTKIIRNASNSTNDYQDSLYATYSILYMKSMLDHDLTFCEIMQNYKKLEVNYELNKDISDNPDISPLLIDRNNKWVKKLKGSFLKNNCFVAVGIRHLFFKQGLISVLRNHGYQVNPVLVY